MNHPDDDGKVIAMTTTLTQVEAAQVTFETTGRVLYQAAGGTNLTFEWRTRVLVTRDGMREMAGTGTATGAGTFRGRAATVALTQFERTSRIAPRPEDLSAATGVGTGAGPGSGAPAPGTP